MIDAASQKPGMTGPWDKLGAMSKNMAWRGKARGPNWVKQRPCR